MRSSHNFNFGQVLLLQDTSGPLAPCAVLTSEQSSLRSPPAGPLLHMRSTVLTSEQSSWRSPPAGHIWPSTVLHMRSTYFWAILLAFSSCWTQLASSCWRSLLGQEQIRTSTTFRPITYKIIPTFQSYGKQKAQVKNEPRKSSDRKIKTPIFGESCPIQLRQQQL